MVNILFFGDVVGKLGCAALCAQLPQLKTKYNAEIVIVNGENAAEGNGILPDNARQLWASGADVITTGNHALRRREIHEMFDEPGQPIIRPANFASNLPGRGVYLLDRLKYRLAVVNLQGQVFLNQSGLPFDCMDKILKTLDTPFVFVDFHAEATSEKYAMAYYLDGKVTAVVGTHTHVQTADERILPAQTAYITDVGMCGGYHSVLGVQPHLAIDRLRTGYSAKFENVKEPPATVCGVCITADEKTGRAHNIERINLLIDKF